MDKNDFYEDRGRKLNHDSWDDIVQDFIQLQYKVKNQVNKAPWHDEGKTAGTDG